MRKMLSILLCLMLFLAPVASLSEDNELSENEQSYLGAWVLYMTGGENTYLYTLTFFDDLQVKMKTMVFNGSTISSDHTASGEWCGFTSDMIILSLAGKSYVAGIKDNGLLTLLDYKSKEPMGFFSRCPDLSDLMTSSENK